MNFNSGSKIMAKGLFTADEAPKSSADIAAMLISPVADDNSPAEGSDDEDLTTDDNVSESEQDQDEGGDANDDSESDASDDSDVDDDADEDDADSDGTDYLDITDDDEIEVMIDGVLETRTIGQLKQAASGEGAIERRLQEATELRKTAHAERTTYLEKLHANETLVATAITSIEEKLYAPLVSAPTAELKQRDAAAYIRHLDAYNADQKRIADLRTLVIGQVKALQDQRAARLNDYSTEAQKQIVAVIPELADPNKQQAMLAGLVETAKLYGYTADEIDSALDPRMFHLVRDAMLYRKAKGVKSPAVGELKRMAEQKKTVRRLRSGTTKGKDKVRESVSQQKAAVEKARSTGSRADVAATLLKPARA